MHDGQGSLRTTITLDEGPASFRNQNLMTSHQDPDKHTARRLKQARIEAGFRTAKQFARSIPVNITTYHHHEVGRRGIPIATAERYATALGITVSSLLHGDQLRRVVTVPIVGIIYGKGLVRRMDDSHWTMPASDGIGAEMEAATTLSQTRELLVPDPADMEALEIHGQELYPVYSDGDTVVTQKLLRHDAIPLHLHGMECVVELADGSRMVRHISIQADGRATLFGHGTPPMLDQVVVACARVEIVYRADPQNR